MSCLLLLLSQPAAATPPSAVAASIPANVVEVVTGGAWTSGPASGYFRTVTIEVADGERLHVEVFIQWVGTRSVNAPVELIASRAIIEFNDKLHGSASVSMEAENAGEVRLEITPESAPDGGDPDSGEPGPPLKIVASEPAHYRVLTPANGTAAN